MGGLPGREAMREFEFVVRFSEGVDELMDVFHEHPELSVRSSACYSSRTAMWRIDHASGSRPAIERFDATFTDETRCNECLDAPDCDTHRAYHTLDSTPTSRTVYTFRREVHRCHSIPHFVVEHVGEGAVFQSQRSDGEYRWKVLYPGTEPVGPLFDEVEATLRGGVALELLHLGESGNWDAESRTAPSLSPEQQAILEAAVEAGYYERPRQVDVATLADRLGVARSTAQYRLRTAEDVVVREFVRNAL